MTRRVLASFLPAASTTVGRLVISVLHPAGCGRPKMRRALHSSVLVLVVLALGASPALGQRESIGARLPQALPEGHTSSTAATGPSRSASAGDAGPTWARYAWRGGLLGAGIGLIIAMRERSGEGAPWLLVPVGFTLGGILGAVTGALVESGRR